MRYLQKPVRLFITLGWMASGDGTYGENYTSSAFDAKDCRLEWEHCRMRPQQLSKADDSWTICLDRRNVQ